MITQRVLSVNTFCSEKNYWSQGKALQQREGGNSEILFYFFKSLCSFSYRALYPFCERLYSCYMGGT